MFQSSKVFDGFSTTFRQWGADGTHCKFVHGYGVSFKVTFEGELDERNWVFDFGGMKRAKTRILEGEIQYTPKEWMDFWFDHTTIVAFDDPELEWFHEAAKRGIIQLRLRPKVGAERFAAFVFNTLDTFVRNETMGRVKVVRVDFRENEKNSASYFGVQPVDNSA